MIYTKTATEHARKNIGGQYDNNLDVWQAGCMFLAYDRKKKDSKIHMSVNY